MMRRRRPLPWLIALGAFAVATATAGIALLWRTSELQAQVFEFYSGSPQQIDEEEYRYWDAVSTDAYTMQSLALPLFVAALAALFALLALLALLQERRERQAVATAASSS